MVKKKYQSKRLSLHKKYKIARKVREHTRQERKKNKLNQHKSKKTPGIPNNWPFKQELLLEVEQARLQQELNAKVAAQQKKDARKERKKAAALARKNGTDGILPMTPASVQLQATRDLKESVKKSDLVLIVLDARDPQGCRSLSLEDGLIAKGNKHIVLVLNKIDLIPTDKAQKWVQYLRRFHPTIAIRSINERIVETTRRIRSRTLQGQKALYERTQNMNEMRDNGSVEPLRYFLDEYSRNAADHVHVAILGYPNVGKSTLLNSLKKRPISIVSKHPNTTKRMVQVDYNDRMVLMDCPALDPDYSDPNAIIMRHGIAQGWLEDPVPTIETLLTRANVTNLMQELQLSLFHSHEEFLSKLATKRNVLRKGGEPDVLQVGRQFLCDLGNGKYSTTCLPPSKSKSRFELPQWFAQIQTPKLEQLENMVFTTNTPELKQELIFSAAPMTHIVGDMTEYDLVMGLLPENDGLTSEEEDDEEMEQEEESEELNGDDETE